MVFLFILSSAFAGAGDNPSRIGIENIAMNIQPQKENLIS